MMLLLSLLLLSVVISRQEIKNISQCNIPTNERQDCGFVGLDQKKCEEKGCCFLKNNLGNHGALMELKQKKILQQTNKSHLKEMTNINMMIDIIIKEKEMMI